MTCKLSLIVLGLAMAMAWRMVGPTDSRWGAQAAEDTVASETSTEEVTGPTEQPAPAEFVGEQMCLTCHEELGRDWEKQPHSRYLLRPKLSPKERGCEACHGPGSQHVIDVDFKKIQATTKSPMEQISQACLQCHQGRVKTVEWKYSEHARHGLACITCHNVHHPRTPRTLTQLEEPALCFSCHLSEKAAFAQNSHHPVLEGRLLCSDCHDPHRAQRGTHSREVVKTGDDTCLTCHVEKQGPFVYEHDMVTASGAEACLTCHQGHGSPQPKLQKMFGRGLCLQCHTDMALDETHRRLDGACWRSGCHRAIHGSNRSRTFLG